MSLVLAAYSVRTSPRENKAMRVGTNEMQITVDYVHGYAFRRYLVFYEVSEKY